MSNLDQFKSFVKTNGQISISGTNAVIYTRVSHSSQEDNTSLGSQLKYCQSFAKRRGLNVIKHFGGKVESAKTDDRKELKRMLKYIKQSKNISYIIVYSYERFSRSGVGGAKIAEELLKNYGVVTLAVTQELDPTTVSGSFQQKIFFLFSQMDNELRRDKTITGMSELIENGYTPHNPPRGYTNLKKGKAIHQNIVVNEEGKLIRKAFMWKANKQLSNMDIIRKLKKIGLDLDKRRLSEIFANPYYCGLLVSKLIPDRIVEGKHEPMISKSIFLKVNNIIANKRNHPTTHKNSDIKLPLKKFMVCNECSTPMTGFLVKAKGLYYYKCRTIGCKHTYSAQKLHQQFLQLLSAFQIDESDIPLITQALKTYFDVILEEEIENKKLANREVTKLKSQLEKIEERFALGEINVEMYTKYKAKYEGELNDKNSIDLPSSSNLEKCIDFAIKKCQNPAEWWESADIELRIRIQKMVFPEGIRLSKQNKGVQTSRINSIFTPIAQIAKLLRENKNGQPVNINELSALVTQNGKKSNQILKHVIYSQEMIG